MAFAIETRRGSPPDRWDEIVAALGAGIFHSSTWALYQRALTGDEPEFFLARDETGAPCAAAVATFRQSRRPIVSLFLRDLALTAHPAARAGAAAAVEAVIRTSEQWGQGQGSATLRLDSFGSGRSAFSPGGHGFKETERVEFVLDLTAGEDPAWQGIDKKQRERIRQLERKGIEVVSERSRTALAELQTLRGSTLRKRTARGQGYSLARDERLDAAIEEHLLRTGHARIFLARSAGAPIAAILFATFAGRAYSVFSGSSEEGYRLGAQSLLYWRAVQAFASEGFVELNRGGVAGATASPDHPLHGIYRFKLRLGTTPLVCRSGSKTLSPIRASLAQALGRLRGGGHEGSNEEE